MPVGQGAGVEPWSDTAALARQDPQIAEVLAAEGERQASGLQLLPAGNFTSPSVLAALASPLAGTYAEGYPGVRQHGGCEIADVAERIATERAMRLFSAGHANVQPYSGSCAVLAAYAALLRPGDRVLAMAPPAGGHLTHGSAANVSGRWYDFTGYGVEESGLIDYEQVRVLARARRPRAIVCGSISYPRHVDHAAFRAIADEVGAYLIADEGHAIGLVAGGAAPSPVPYADVVCATTHKVLRGPPGGMLLSGPELGGRLDHAVFPLTQGGAHLHTIAAKAVAFGEAATPAFAGYARQTVANARWLAQALAAEGLPIVTGGTDTHLLAADPAPLGVDGRTARGRLAAAGIVVDAWAMPRTDAFGLRLGTAAVTTQGMREAEMTRIAKLFAAVLRDDLDVTGVRAEVRELTAAFPPYPSHPPYPPYPSDPSDPSDPADPSHPPRSPDAPQAVQGPGRPARGGPGGVR